jgi:hypothetical protein
MTRCLSVLFAAAVSIAIPRIGFPAETLPPRHSAESQAVPAPKRTAPGSNAIDRQCRDGTYADTVSGHEAPCRDHGGVATTLEKDRTTGEQR